MKNNSMRRGRGSGGKLLSIHTTILELVRAFNEQSRDDGLVVAAVSHFLNSGRVRSGRSLMPVKVVALRNGGSLLTGRRRHRREFANC